jgi:predicted cupin superfamily sugar epimerase
MPISSAELKEYHTVEHMTARRCPPNLSRPSVVVAYAWQAARAIGACTLVGCTVGPGFEFSDFEMLDSRSDLPPR